MRAVGHKLLTVAQHLDQTGSSHDRPFPRTTLGGAADVRGSCAVIAVSADGVAEHGDCQFPDLSGCLVVLDVDIDDTEPVAQDAGVECVPRRAAVRYALWRVLPRALRPTFTGRCLACASRIVGITVVPTVDRKRSPAVVPVAIPGRRNGDQEIVNLWRWVRVTASRAR